MTKRRNQRPDESERTERGAASHPIARRDYSVLASKYLIDRVAAEFGGGIECDQADRPTL